MTEIYNKGLETEYALEKTDKHNTLYTAFCIEYGEKFESAFYAPKDLPKSLLQEIGNELASDWGGECIRVKKELSEEEKFYKDLKKWKYNTSTKPYGRRFKVVGEIYTHVGFSGKRKLIIANSSGRKFELKLPARVPDYVIPQLPWIDA